MRRNSLSEAPAFPAHELQSELKRYRDPGTAMSDLRPGTAWPIPFRTNGPSPFFTEIGVCPNTLLCHHYELMEKKRSVIFRWVTALREAVWAFTQQDIDLLCGRPVNTEEKRASEAAGRRFEMAVSAALILQTRFVYSFAPNKDRAWRSLRDFIDLHGGSMSEKHSTANSFRRSYFILDLLDLAVPWLKYHFSALVAQVLSAGTRTVLELPPAPENFRNEKPGSFLRSGGACYLFWLRIVGWKTLFPGLHSDGERAAALAHAIGDLKRAMPPPGVSMCLASANKTFEKLTTAPSKPYVRTPMRYLFELAVRQIIRKSLRTLPESRVVRDDTPVRPAIPSVRGRIDNPSRAHGVHGALHARGAFQSPLTCPSCREVGGDDEDPRGPGGCSCRNILVRPLSEKRQANLVSLVSLPEPLKVRVISLATSSASYPLQHLKDFMWGLLEQHDAFRFALGPLDTDLVNLALGPPRERTLVHSGDYSDATNSMFLEVSTLQLQILSEELSARYPGQRFTEVIEAMRTGLTGPSVCPPRHDPLDPLFFAERTGRHPFITDPTYDVPPACYGSGDAAARPMRRGQLMGCEVSFPLLCIANLANHIVASALQSAGFTPAGASTLTGSAIPESLIGQFGAAIAACRKRDLRVQSLGALINGDDCLKRMQHGEVQIFWSVADHCTGMSESVGKSFKSEDLAVINSQPYVWREGKFRPVRGVPLYLCQENPQMRPRSIPGRDWSDEVPEAPLEGRLASRCEFMLRVCRGLEGREFGPIYDRLLTIMIRNNATALDSLRPRGIPWFTPIYAGGVGLITGRECALSPVQRAYTLLSMAQALQTVDPSTNEVPSARPPTFSGAREVFARVTEILSDLGAIPISAQERAASDDPLPRPSPGFEGVLKMVRFYGEMLPFGVRYPDPERLGALGEDPFSLAFPFFNPRVSFFRLPDGSLRGFLDGPCPEEAGELSALGRTREEWLRGRELRWIEICAYCDDADLPSWLRGADPVSLRRLMNPTGVQPRPPLRWLRGLALPYEPPSPLGWFFLDGHGPRPPVSPPLCDDLVGEVEALPGPTQEPADHALYERCVRLTRANPRPKPPVPRWARQFSDRASGWFDEFFMQSTPPTNEFRECPTCSVLRPSDADQSNPGLDPTVLDAWAEGEVGPCPFPLNFFAVPVPGPIWPRRPQRPSPNVDGFHRGERRLCTSEYKDTSQARERLWRTASDNVFVPDIPSPVWDRIMRDRRARFVTREMSSYTCLCGRSCEYNRVVPFGDLCQKRPRASPSLD